MDDLRFRIVIARDSTPQEWLRIWAGKYEGDDDEEHDELINLAKSSVLTRSDFVRIGLWKEGLKSSSDGRWRADVASVAYLVWMKISEQAPKCPDIGGEATFLEQWSEQRYTDTYPNGTRNKRFGLSRATALLHFVSGGRFPIFDSRVRSAIVRLGHPQPAETVDYYLNTYCPLFSHLLDRCKTKDVRALDKALFSYGASMCLPEAYSE